MAGTPLQAIYTSFSSKMDEDMTGQESKVYQWFISSKAKCKKYVIHSLEYVLDEPIPPSTVSYDGYFIDTLDDDEIDLIAMQMKYESYDKKEAYLIALRRDMGTKDFNNLPNKKQELDGIQNSKRLLKEDINELKQQFNTFKYD